MKDNFIVLGAEFGFSEGFLLGEGFVAVAGFVVVAFVFVGFLSFL